MTMEVLYWLIATAVFIIIEIISLGLTSIWFAGGSIFAALASALGFGIEIQFTLFIAVTLILFVFTRPIAQKYINAKVVKTNSDSLIGKTAVITLKVDNLKSEGQAIVNGQEWTARSFDENVTIEENEKVIIKEIKGVKLIVEPIDKM